MQADRQAVICNHCGLVVPEALIEQDAPQQFCCGGCRVAYETINACGLADYYRQRERFAGEGQSVPASAGRYAAYDSDVFLAKHVRSTAAGFSTIELRLEGVHCAACVWLVERLAHIVPGVIETRLTLHSATAHLVWQPGQVPLSHIAKVLDELGYPPHPTRDAAGREARQRTERKRLVELAVAGALAGNSMLIAVALYAGLFDGIAPEFVRLFRWVSLLLGVVSLAWPGARFFRGAWAALRARSANLDLPIALALATGGLAGTVNVLLDRGEIYFDSLSVLIFLLLVGRYLQARQQRWAEDAVGLTLSLTPVSCRVVRENQLVEEPVELLEPEDEVEVRSGELFPADGEVRTGTSSVDCSLLTGEAAPQGVGPGDEAFAGTQNVGATLRLRVTSVGDASRVGRLMRLVEQGANAKPPIVLLTDRIAGWFVLFVSCFAILNLAVWFWQENLTAAIDSTVALLIVACPCALGLATPLTIAMAIGNASRRGLLVKDAAVLERLGRVSPSNPGRVFFDKTGTLTQGNFQVIAWHGDASHQRQVAALEAKSNHPVARALAALVTVEEQAKSSVFFEAEDHLHGGVSGQCEAGQLCVGSPRYLRHNAIEVPPSLAERIEEGECEGNTVVAVGLNGGVVAVVWLCDQPLEDAHASILQLQCNGWRSEVLSGDAAGPVRATATRLGILPGAAHANRTPEQKLAYVRSATESAHEHEVVVMAGDGVNDSAALAAADVGIAVRGGAEASLAAADVYATQRGITPLVDLIALSRRTLRVVRTNLVVSLAYNATAVTLAALGWVTPLMAAVLMPISSATVLAIAIGTLGRKL